MTSSMTPNPHREAGADDEPDLALKPCPFCGCHASIRKVDNDESYWVECEMCGVRGQHGKWQVNVAAWWNSRFDEGANQEAGAALPIVERVARMKRKTGPQRDWETLSEVQDTIEELVEALNDVWRDGTVPDRVRRRVRVLLAKLEAGDGV